MKKLISLLISGIVIVAGIYTYKTIFNPVDSENMESYSVNISKGTNAKQIASILKEKNLIKDENTFYLYVRLTGSAKDIIAGRYDLNTRMNVPDIIEQITKIGSSEATLTVQEGLTISAIDDKLLNLGVIDDGDFEKAVKNFDNYEDYWFLDKSVQNKLEYPLEGFLYPDTYFIDTVNFKSESLIRLMLDNFEQKVADIKTDLIKSDRTIHEMITIASILQREVRTPEDYEIISGILWKRLDSNWHLGADATILYATKKKDIDAGDLDFDSPYNTRLYVGMPPGPICNPDIEHIKGTLYPKASEYWYYLTTPDTGEVIYARNNDEHNINKAKYLY